MDIDILAWRYQRGSHSTSGFTGYRRQIHPLSRVFSCTSNGALRLVSLDQEDGPKLSSLPTRLEDWRMSPDQDTFAYGGEEVELSVWDTEKAFSASPQDGSAVSKKRKRNELLPGEIWRAKNVGNKQHL